MVVSKLSENLFQEKLFLSKALQEWEETIAWMKSFGIETKKQKKLIGIETEPNPISIATIYACTFIK